MLKYRPLSLVSTKKNKIKKSERGKEQSEEVMGGGGERRKGRASAVQGVCVTDTRIFFRKGKWKRIVSYTNHSTE